MTANQMSRFSRRTFALGAAAAGAGLVLGFDLRLGEPTAARADEIPEINAWVVIRSDDTVVIGIARSEMG